MSKVRVGEEGKTEIFDPIRKKWLIQTPEEVVRQTIIEFLIGKGVQKELIGVEIGFNLSNGKQQRLDLLLYNRDGSPLMIIECKAESVRLTSDIFTQISKYNSFIKAPYIMITNQRSNFIYSTHDFVTYKPETGIDMVINRAII